MAAAVKICGLTTAAAVEASLTGGADYLGFNFFPASPRFVAPEAAAALAAPARGQALIVAVTVDPDDALLDRLMATLRPDLIQLHGAETADRARAVVGRTGAPLIKALPVAGPGDLASARGWEETVDHVMLDARAPAGADRPGGHGAAFDWSWVADLGLRRRWFLAGGLTPANVGEAARLTGAPVLDVSSGVEREVGLKDPALIAAFLAAARRA